MDYFVWNVSPELFRIGSLSVRWYGLLFALGFIIGYEIMAYIFKKEGKRQKDLDSLTVFMVVSTVVGARLGHCFFYEPAYYLANPIEILMVWQGGLASHGAAIGILIGLWLFIKKRKNEFSVLWLLDRLVITVALAGSFIRLGNFFNSEILGAPANVAWAVIFSRIDDLPRHPAQLYESASYFILFLILGWYYLKSKGKIASGRLFGIFLTICFGARFIIEFFKEMQSNLETNMIMHLGQSLSIPLILFGIFFWVRSYRKSGITA